jgi:hypothetical protein
MQAHWKIRNSLYQYINADLSVAPYSDPESTPVTIIFQKIADGIFTIGQVGTTNLLAADGDNVRWSPDFNDTCHWRIWISSRDTITILAYLSGRSVRENPCLAVSADNRLLLIRDGYYSWYRNATA